MALIDVSDLLVDPDFISACSFIHRTTTVNSLGENVLTEGSPIASFASIQPASGKDLLRIPEALRERDVRAVFAKTEILTNAAGVYPDIMIYGALRFQLINTLPWLNYGQGWNQALFVAEKPSLG